tara:strand:- start:35294 stop:35545 length:252 start_codon:yes stop_codon:yes gene_type:complete
MNIDDALPTCLVVKGSIPEEVGSEKVLISVDVSLRSYLAFEVSHEDVLEAKKTSNRELASSGLKVAVYLGGSVWILSRMGNLV